MKGEQGSDQVNFGYLTNADGQTEKMIVASRDPR